jgi:signal transduction histidine kinase/ligand-binding sensor domain-containing protein/DNA-binding response OmpR family regulator
MKRKLNTNSFCSNTFVFALLLAANLHPLYSQQRNPEIKRFAKNNLLSQTIVEEVFQDEKGFMWFGTYDGLLRFDGHQTKHFKYNHLDENSISNDVVTSIVQADDGMLWIGTHMGLNSYDPSNEKFTRYYASESNENSLKSNQINSLMIDSSGILWISTYFGLSIMDTQEEKVIANYPNPLDSLDYNGVLIYFVMQLNDSVFWVSGSSGLSSVQVSGPDYSNLDFVGVKRNNSDLIFRANNAVRDKTGKYWIRSGSNLFIYEDKTKEISQISFENDFFDHRLNYVTSDNEGNIWLGLSDFGFVKLFPERIYKDDIHKVLSGKLLTEGDDFISYKTKSIDGLDIPFNRIRSSWFDSSGMFWIGSYDGAFNLDLSHKPFNWYCRFANNYSTKCDDITAVSESNEGDILFGTSNSTLFRFDPQSRETEIIPLNISGSLMVSAIHTDPYGYTWLGVTGGGIVKLDQEGKFVKRYSPESSDSVRLETWTVWCLLEDKDENLWVGTGSGLEKFKLSPEINGSREFISKKRYADDINDIGAIKGGNIWAMFEDNSGRIWVGSNMGGLFLYKPERDNFRIFDVVRGSSSDLQSFKINVIMQDHRGLIWLGTEYGFAAMTCDETDYAEFRTFTEIDGLCNNGVTGILEDDHGDLWISTKDGLSRFSPPEMVFDRSERGEFHNYSSNDGLQSNKFNPFAYAQSWTGEMFFGGNKGLSSFYPDSVIMSNPLSGVILTNFRISNEEVHAGDTINRRFIFDKSISYLDKITLTHRENAVTFEFSGIDFSSPENTNYSWMLEGFDTEWNYFGTDHRIATYTNLPPGKYLFRVKTISSDFSMSSPETSVELIILTPFWQAWWFKILSVIFIMGIVISYFRYRTYNLKKQSEILRKQVKERTSDLENANLQLETKNEEIVSQHEHIENQATKLRKQNQNLRLLDEIGQNITSSIKVKEIIIKVYDIINELMDAPAFHIGIVDHKQNIVSFWGRTALEKPLNSEIISLDNKDRFSVECIRKGKTVLMNDIEKDIKAFQANSSKIYIADNLPKSSIYIPLLSIDNKVTGILVAKSFRKNSFSDSNVYLLKNMANYISIALDNARAYNVIEEKSEELTQMDKIKTRFFTNISHEFRTPLTLILSPVRNMIQKGDKMDIEVIDELGLVERNAERLLRLINQLLDISKIEGETLKLKVAKDNLVKSVYRIVEPFYLYSNYKNINLSVKSDQQNHDCYYDYDKIEKILYNILSNAIKYTHENGEVDLSIEFIKKEKSTEFVNISVSDTGIGIPEEALESIFERFARIENPLSDYVPGTGVGLSLVKKLVELHKGKITVESNLDKGSCFFVQIPVSKDNYTKDEISDDSSIIEKSQRTKASFSHMPDKWTLKRKSINKDFKTILIIEDNPDVSYYLGNHFSSKYNVLLAINGKEGFEKAMMINPDLVISDIMMPEMNGIELCEQMKTNEATSHIPIILLTARADEKLQKSGYETGADDYMLKPFSIDILEKRVKNLIRMREQMKNRFYSGSLPEPKEFSPSHTDEILLRKILDSIESNISNSDFNIDILIKEVGISRAQLFRKIKSLTNNQSVSDFIITYRLQRAAQLFGKGHSNVSEVAYHVGFKNTSHFATRFKKKFGKAPKDFIGEAN